MDANTMFLVGPGFGFRLGDVHHWTVDTMGDKPRTTVFFYANGSNRDCMVVEGDLSLKFVKAIAGPDAEMPE